MIRASTRDASFYRRPNVRSVKVYHVIDKPGWSACGRMLYETHDALTDGRDAAEVPAGLRCQRPGCKTRWPATDGVAPPRDSLTKAATVAALCAHTTGRLAGNAAHGPYWWCPKCGALEGPHGWVLPSNAGVPERVMDDEPVVGADGRCRFCGQMDGGTL